MIDSGVARRARDLSLPIGAYLELTYVCNWHCVFCYNPRRHDVKPLSPAEWCGALDSLRRLGTLTVVLTGGEPLVHPQFFEIAAAARERAFALRIFTNGSMIDDAKAERIASLDPLTVELSLHGASAAVHEQTTGVPGSYASVLAAVDRLSRHGVRTVLKTPVTSMNEAELESMIQLCREHAVPLRIDGVITPRDDGDASPLRHTASLDARRRVMAIAAAGGSIALRHREYGEDNCGVGRLSIVIGPEGEVYPCMQWRHRALGNIRENALERIWADSGERHEAIRTSVEANDALLRSGRSEDAFPFCPAVALQRTGSAITADPEFTVNSALAREAVTRS